MSKEKKGLENLYLLIEMGYKFYSSKCIFRQFSNKTVPFEHQTLQFKVNLVFCLI